MNALNTSSKKLAIISVAMLKVNWDEQGKDYVSYLMPFVSNVLRDFKGREITAGSVGYMIEQTYGLKIPNATAELCLRRLAKTYLQKENHRYWLREEPAISDFEVQKSFAQKHTDRAIKALQAFVKSAYGDDWTEDECLDAVLFYLNQFGIECLSAFQGKSVLPESNVTDPKRVDFRVNAFIREIKDKDAQAWDSMTVLVRAQMASNALLCPDLEAIQKNFSKITFYLDTRLLLRLLGLEGKENLAAATELIRLLKGLGGKVSYFAHTAQELDRILTQVRRYLNSDKGRGPAIWHSRAERLSDGDLALIQTTVKDRLQKFELFLTPTPQYSKNFQIDEKKFGEFLEGEIDDLRENAKDHDINCVRSIYELRAGIAPSRLEDSKAVLVTTNSALSRAAYHYGKQFESCREVSAVITDYSVTNVAWLKQPIQMVDVPAREMLTLAYAAIQPPAQLWDKYLSEAEKLAKDGTITPEAHSLLRYHFKAREELMSLTEGAEQELTSATVVELLARLEEELRRKEAEKLSAEKGAHEITQTKLLTSEDQRTADKLHREALCHRISNGLAWGAFGLLAILLAVGAVVSAYYLSDCVKWNSRWKWPLLALAAFALISSIVGNIWGWTLADLRERVASVLYKKLAAILSPPQKA